ncbi:MAG: hypothetical protein AAFQ66_01650 [Pseudomonadota bacterium]
MNRFALAILSLAVVAGCATPQERCIRQETQELSTVLSLLSKVDGNLARGYAIEREPYSVPIYQVCSTSRNKDGKLVQDHCWKNETFFRDKEVPIDPASESRKRQALQDRARTLERQSAAGVARCKAEFAE